MNEEIIERLDAILLQLATFAGDENPEIEAAMYSIGSAQTLLYATPTSVKNFDTDLLTPKIRSLKPDDLKANWMQQYDTEQVNLGLREICTAITESYRRTNNGYTFIFPIMHFSPEENEKIVEALFQGISNVTWEAQEADTLNDKVIIEFLS